jgi:hypothetical protein
MPQRRLDYNGSRDDNSKQTIGAVCSFSIKPFGEFREEQEACALQEEQDARSATDHVLG